MEEDANITLYRLKSPRQVDCTHTAGQIRTPIRSQLDLEFLFYLAGLALDEIVSNARIKTPSRLICGWYRQTLNGFSLIQDGSNLMRLCQESAK